MDHGDQLTINDEQCNAVTARYELQNNEERTGFECNDAASDGDCGRTQCKECFELLLRMTMIFDNFENFLRL